MEATTLRRDFASFESGDSLPVSVIQSFTLPMFIKPA